MIADRSETPIDGEPTKLPGTLAENTEFGGTDWTSASNLKAIDGSYASVVLSGAGESALIEATNLGFAIPTGSTILAITPSLVNCRCINGNAKVRMGLIKAGVLQEEKEVTLKVPTVESMLAFPGGLFEGTYAPSDINAKTFGFDFAVRSPGLFGDTFTADAAQVAIAYAETAGENRVCFASRSVEFTDTGVRRQHASEEVWGDLVPDGFLLYAPPPGQGAQPVRALIVPSVGDFDTRPDSAPVKLSAKVSYRPGYLFAREARE